MLKYRWTLVAIVYFAAVVVANLLSGTTQSSTGLLALVPVLLALEWGSAVVVLGSLPLVVLAGTNVFRGDLPVSATIIRTVGVAVGVGIGAFSATFRERHVTSLSLSRAAAVAAQEAIIPAVPESLGRYRFASAYRSAADEALVGGDLYKVIETDFGVRLLIGDVRGKGLEAVAMTSAVLGCFSRVGSRDRHPQTPRREVGRPSRRQGRSRRLRERHRCLLGRRIDHGGRQLWPSISCSSNRSRTAGRHCSPTEDHPARDGPRSGRV